MTTSYEDENGITHYHVSKDALIAASFLDNDDAPELTKEQFDQLTEEMRKVREGEDEGKPDC